MPSGAREVFGREGEVAVVSSFLDDTTSGPAALLLEGEAGVGKTTLWREGVEAAGGRDSACSNAISPAGFAGHRPEE